MKKKVASYSLILLFFVVFAGLIQAWKENRNPFGMYSKTKIQNKSMSEYLSNDGNKIKTDNKNYSISSNIRVE